VTVEFELITVTLTTSVVGGHGTLAPLTGPQVQDAVVDLTASPDAGYRVKTWTGTANDALKTNTNTVLMSSDKSVTVEFEPITVTLTTSVVGGHGTLAPLTGPQTVNTTVTLLASPEAGYRVKTWTGTANDALKTNTNTVFMSADKTVTVEFEQVTFMLTTAVIGGHGTLAPLTGLQAQGTTVSLLASADAGYRVKTWTGTANDALKTNANTVLMTSDKTVTVEFESVPTFDLVGKWRVDSTLTKGTVTMWSILSNGPFVSSPDGGSGTWSLAGTDFSLIFSNNTTYVGTVNDATSMSGTFLQGDGITGGIWNAKLTNVLTTSVIGAHGTLTPATGPQLQGSTVALLANPDPQYVVKAWTGTANDALTTNANTVVMTGGDKTVYVQFEFVGGEGEGEGEGEGGGGGPCFIATAAYGTPLASDINTLRALRDRVLLTSAVGTAFVEGYYHASPYVADFVAKSPVLASMVRVALVPVIMLSKVAMAVPVWSLSLSLACASILIARRVLRRKA
jgi:hypothetical protein